MIKLVKLWIVSPLSSLYLFWLHGKGYCQKRLGHPRGTTLFRCSSVYTMLVLYKRVRHKSEDCAFSRFLGFARNFVCTLWWASTNADTALIWPINLYASLLRLLLYASLLCLLPYASLWRLFRFVSFVVLRCMALFYSVLLVFSVFRWFNQFM